MSDTTSKKETAESKKLREQRERQELEKKRHHQLEDAERILAFLKKALLNNKSATEECAALSNHATGFHQEITKLTKGKLLIGVTDLAVENANNIIRDAKKVITKDVHLSRIKEFVPAGDNPVYPDVLVVIRAVRDSLQRGDIYLKNRTKVIQAQIEKAQTLIGALQYFFDEDTTEEDRRYPALEAIYPFVDGRLADSCFSTFADSYDKYFNFGLLDGQSVEAYLSIETDQEDVEKHEGNQEDEIDEVGEAENTEDGDGEGK